MKVIKNKDRIESLLLKKPHLRDDDNALLACVWWIEAMDKLNASEFHKIQPLFNLIAKGDLSNAETIRRTRAKLQQECPELRGEAYKRRHGKEQDEAKADLEAFRKHEQRGQITLGI